MVEVPVVDAFTTKTPKQGTLAAVHVADALGGWLRGEDAASAS
jgi:hypothetical protein